ncbi:recombinase RecT [Alienimonas sp. DA493]|uniref:recombinase RecT n=1 Tax=Alienimonas sp. DA493 TaxID=3373605 RepID=UPI003754A8F6
MGEITKYAGTPIEGLDLPGKPQPISALSEDDPKRVVAAGRLAYGHVVQLLPDPTPAKAKAFFFAADASLRKVEQSLYKPDRNGNIPKVPTDSSVRTALANACVLGLLPDTSEGLCHLVPKGGELQLWMGYRGLLRLAMASDFLRVVHPEVVYKGEEFRYWVDDDGPHIHHDLSGRVFKLPSEGDVVGAYMTYVQKDGERGLFFVPGEELKKLNGPVYKKNRIAMYRKTPIVRGGKLWDTRADDRFMRAVRIEEEAERGEPQSLPDGFEMPGVLEARAVRRLTDTKPEDDIAVDAEVEPPTEDAELPRTAGEPPEADDDLPNEESHPLPEGPADETDYGSQPEIQW